MLLPGPGSVVGAHRLSCPVTGWILVPQPVIKPMSTVLVGRFLTTEPLRKSMLASLTSIQAQTASVCGPALLPQAHLFQKTLHALTHSWQRTPSQGAVPPLLSGGRGPWPSQTWGLYLASSLSFPWEGEKGRDHEGGSKEHLGSFQGGVCNIGVGWG